MARQRIIHLSDLHIGRRDRERVRTDRIIEAIRQFPKMPGSMVSFPELPSFA